MEVGGAQTRKSGFGNERKQSGISDSASAARRLRLSTWASGQGTERRVNGQITWVQVRLPHLLFVSVSSKLSAKETKLTRK